MIISGLLQAITNLAGLREARAKQWRDTKEWLDNPTPKHVVFQNCRIVHDDGRGFKDNNDKHAGYVTAREVQMRIGEAEARLWPYRVHLNGALNAHSAALVIAIEFSLYRRAMDKALESWWPEC